MIRDAIDRALGVTSERRRRAASEYLRRTDGEFGPARTPEQLKEEIESINERAALDGTDA